MTLNRVKTRVLINMNVSEIVGIILKVYFEHLTNINKKENNN